MVLECPTCFKRTIRRTQCAHCPQLSHTILLHYRGVSLSGRLLCVHCDLTLTLRKFSSLLFSIVYFRHFERLSALDFAGIGMVALGSMLYSFAPKAAAAPTPVDVTQKGNGSHKKRRNSSNTNTFMCLCRRAKLKQNIFQQKIFKLYSLYLAVKRSNNNNKIISLVGFVLHLKKGSCKLSIALFNFWKNGISTKAIILSVSQTTYSKRNNFTRKRKYVSSSSPSSFLFLSLLFFFLGHSPLRKFFFSFPFK